MKKIPIKFKNKTLYALVDDEDFERLSKVKWHVSTKGYATTKFRDNFGKQMNIPMHSFVLNTYGVGVKGNFESDHKDLNKLNNQKYNLRKATRSQNMANRPKSKNNTSGYKGVQKANNKWQAIIKGKYIGIFKSKKEAAKAYNKKAKELYGEFAYLNPL